MSRPTSSHGVVCLPALDLRTRPDHAAELGSQLLLGEVVRALAADRSGGWWRVRNLADGYEGWVRAWGLVPASAHRAARWQARARARIGAAFTLARARPGAGAAVSPVFLGGRVIGRGRRGRFRAVELPDGRRGWLPHADLASGRSRPDLRTRILSLLGVPYLWGGRTPAGYDCSSFVQQVLLEQGIRLPRDAHAQWRACRALSGGAAGRPGDLAFFSRSPRGRMGHVGMGLGGAWLADCRGRVRVISLDRNNPMCDKDLLPQFRGWFRPRGRAPAVHPGAGRTRDSA